MKKILIYISVLTALFTASVMISSAYAQASTQSPVEELLELAKGKPKTAVAQDMYLEIYKKINADPSKQAAKTSASKFGMSEEDLKKVVSEGNLSSIIGNEKEPKLDDIAKKYSKVLQEYQTSLNTENLRADLESNAKPSEIFADGDTSNSEFDLLYDLTVIEVILFNEGSVGSFAGAFQTPDYDYSDPADKAEIQDLFGENAILDEDTLQTLNNIQAEQQAEEASDKLSPLSCLEEDQNLQNALNDFDNAQETAPKETDTTEGEGLGDGVTTDDNGFPKAESGDWPANFLCPDGAFFCIEISFDVKSSKIYGKTDNCLACHVSNINKEFDKMLSKPLSPNKVSGNIFEVNKCKSAFSNIDVNMNVITIAVPPPNQAKTDLMVQLNIDKEWQKFQERYLPFFYDSNTELPQQNLEDRSLKKALTNAGPDKSFEDVINKSSEISTIQLNQQTKGITDKDKELKAETQNKQFQTLITEMSAMKTYFDSMKQLFEKMIVPCNELYNKPYCS